MVVVIQHRSFDDRSGVQRRLGGLQDLKTGGGNSFQHVLLVQDHSAFLTLRGLIALNAFALCNVETILSNR